MKIQKSCGRPSCLCTTSLVFMVLGVVFISFCSNLYELIMSKTLVLKENSFTFDIWRKNPVPLTIDFYFYNWTNPDSVRNDTVKPKFHQMGPYRFREIKEKSNITWNSNNTVTFKHLRRWFFDEANSVGTLTDEITTINPISLSAAYAARNWNYIVKTGLSVTLNSITPTIHVTKTVGQLLFDGYEDPLMNIARSMPFLAGNNIPPMDRFGWFYGRNGSEDYEGTFNMDTGVSGVLGKIYQWRGANSTNYYVGNCNAVDGSAGEFFPRRMSEDSVLKFFNSDLCRSVEMEFSKKVLVHDIEGFKYTAGQKFLDNGTKIPENKCYCIGNCMPSGAVNVSACRYGSPAFVSLPNFFNADPYYYEAVDGLQPDASKHEFYMIFEPKTAMPLEVAARLQLNLLLQPIDNIGLYSSVPTAYMPILWFEQVVRLPKEMSTMIKLLVNFEVICISIGVIFIFIAIILQVLVLYKIFTRKLCDRQYETVIMKEKVPLNVPE